MVAGSLKLNWQCHRKSREKQEMRPQHILKFAVQQDVCLWNLCPLLCGLTKVKKYDILSLCCVPRLTDVLILNRCL